MRAPLTLITTAVALLASGAGAPAFARAGKPATAASRPSASQPAASQPAASQPAASQPAASPRPAAPQPAASPRAKPGPEGALIIEHHERERAVPAGEPIQISARIRPRGAGGVADISARLFFRAAGESKYHLSVMQRIAAMRFAARVPPFAVVPPALEYYIEAKLVGERTLRGSASSPLRLPVAGQEVGGPPGTTPWYKRWYVWAAIGIVVAGVTAAIIVAVNQPDADVPLPQQQQP